MLHNKLIKKITVEPMTLRIAGFVAESTVDGPGLRSVIFVQGCPHDCPGCHNPETHSYGGGYESDTVSLWQKINADPMLEGVTFSGGEPFLWGRELAAIGRAAHKKGLTVLTFSGYTYEQLNAMADRGEKGVAELLTVTDQLIDGPYVEKLRDLTLRFRGSSNQRILDISAWPGNREPVVIEPKT